MKTRSQSSSVATRMISCYGNQKFSKQKRSGAEMKRLEEQGKQAVIVELQGSLFFGTKDQLYNSLESELSKCKYLIVALRA